MRRAAILLVSLSILSISSLALTGALVNSRRADAYFESELLCGERADFEGVTIGASTSLSGLIGNRLYYGLSYDAAADESACEYSFNERTSRSDAADTDKEPVYADLQVYFEDGAARWELYDPQSHEELGSGTSEELGTLTEGAQSLRCYRLGGSWVIEAAYTDTAEYWLLASRWSEEYGLYMPDAGTLSLVKSCSSLSTVGEAPGGGLLLLEKVGADYLLSQFDASARLLTSSGQCTASCCATGCSSAAQCTGSRTRPAAATSTARPRTASCSTTRGSTASTASGSACWWRRRRRSIRNRTRPGCPCPNPGSGS